MGSGKKRSISSFMFQEMLYDYVSGALDEQRTFAMDEYIEQNPEAKKEVEAVEQAISFCHKLGETELSQPLVDEIQRYQGTFTKLVDQMSFKNWPEFMRWGAEALSISVVVAMFVIFVPWQEYLEDLRTQGSEIKAPTGEELPIDSHSEPNISESTDESSSNLQATKVSREEKDSSNATVESPTQTTKVEQIKVSESASSKTTSTPTVKKGPAKSEKPKLRGELYRAYMKLPDLVAATPQIVGLITQLNGKKAGQVKLGWEKPTSRYFHFAMPEANYESLIQGLRDYGPVRIYKYTHRRIMPEGQIRIILEVEKN